tara:strand:+ start:2909 stop:3106 length:198 start_codon:yes stop_codon:yes gene_type:complete
MSILFFAVGFVIFSVYLFFLIWNISKNTKKQLRENSTNIDDDNPVDYDGGGNWGRFPDTNSTKKK